MLSMHGSGAPTISSTMSYVRSFRWSPLADGKLGTFLDIDDERDRDTGIVRPADGRWPPTIAAEIACPRAGQRHATVLKG